MRTVSVLLVLTLAMASMPAQQPNNNATGSMVINGVGAAPTAGPFTINIAPPQTMTIAMAGPAGAPFAIFNADPAQGGAIVNPGVSTSFGIVNIGPISVPPIVVVVDGISTQGTIFGDIFRIGATGTSSYSLTFTGAVPCGTVLANLQAAVLQPSGNPFALTAAYKIQRLLPGVDAAPVPIAVGDDVTAQAQISNCSTFTFYGVAYASYFVNSNGNVTFGVGDTSLGESQAGFNTGRPRIASFWDDLNPAAGGTLTKFDNGTTIVVQWTNVPEYAVVNQNNASITMNIVSSDITITWGACALLDSLAGITPGLSLASPVTAFGPTSALGRLSSRLAGGANGLYTGGPMESMDELFISPATATNGTFDLSNKTANFTPGNIAITAYTLF